MRDAGVAAERATIPVRGEHKAVSVDVDVQGITRLESKHQPVALGYDYPPEVVYLLYHFTSPLIELAVVKLVSFKLPFRPRLAPLS